MTLFSPGKKSLAFLSKPRQFLTTPCGLETACIELAGILTHDPPSIDVAAMLDRLATDVQARLRSADQEAMIAHLHDVLFRQEGFRGNLESYYVIENQLISSVLSRKQGMPVTLAVIYKRVADRLGLNVEGLNTPGHFLIRVKDRHGWLVVDPFCGGRVMKQEEAIHRLSHATGWPSEEIRPHFQPIASQDWLHRCLLSLQSGLRRSGQHEHLEVIDEAIERLRRL